MHVEYEYAPLKIGDIYTDYTREVRVKSYHLLGQRTTPRTLEDQIIRFGGKTDPHLPWPEKPLGPNFVGVFIR